MPVLLLVLVVGAVGAVCLALAGRRRVDVPALPVGLAAVQARTARWRTAGLLAGIVVAAVATQSGALGRGTALAGPLLALCVLAGVVCGELLLPAAGEGAARAAVLEVRRVRDYVPRLLSVVVLTSAAVLAAVLTTTTAMGSADDLGRAGRSLFRRCSAVMGEGAGPWPGSSYSAPLALVVVAGALAAGVALLRIVRRPRTWDDREADDALRRRAAEAVVAAGGLLVAIPLLGVSMFAATALLNTGCRPASWTALGWTLLSLVPLQLALAGWCAGLLLSPSRLPVRPVPRPSERAR